MSYPLYDRSGVDDAPAPLAAPPSKVSKRAPPTESEVLVCHAGTCRRRGAEAVLAEIEELVGEMDGCTVRPSGCQGYCSEGPNAIVRARGRPPKVHVRLRSLEASARVAESATGRPAKLDEQASGRLGQLRAVRARQRATSLSLWNAALKGIAEEAEARPALRAELQSLLANAGFPNGIGPLLPLSPTMPASILNYSPWTLQGVTPVSTHSAIFRLTSADRKRGTPHVRGSGRLPVPNTWHTTMLAKVGPNDEGPLPWIERDYTPISSAKEWEQGRCELLVKIYPNGAATSWLAAHAAAAGGDARVWLSKPARTLRVPDLTGEDGGGGRAFRPASVLLVVAGTGIVALPQLLAHRDPMKLLGISTPRRDQLHVPIDLVYSCREDDVLMLPQLAQWCRDGDGGDASGVRRCTLLLTPANAQPGCFGDAAAGTAAEAEELLQSLPNVRIVRSQLSAEVVMEATGRMAQPCRVVVSGPGPFNLAAKRMLAELNVDDESVTILSA